MENQQIIVEVCLACVVDCENCNCPECCEPEGRNCCKDCADICALCAKLCERNSVFTGALMALCVQACERCIENCSKYDRDCCKKCVESCQKCIEAFKI